MKKIILLIFAFSLFYITLQAQQVFQFLNENNEDITGLTINVPTTLGDAEISFGFKIKNMTSENLSAQISKRATEGPVEGSFNSMCSPKTVLSQGGACSVGATSSVFTLQANEVSDIGHFQFTQGPNPGVTTIVYKVYNTNNSGQFSMLTLKFSTPSSINTSVAQLINVYPNPATNYINIEHNIKTKAVIEIYDVLGKNILKYNADNSNSYFSIDCSKWDNGYYFCRISSEGKIEKTIKLVVTH